MEERVEDLGPAQMVAGAERFLGLSARLIVHILLLSMKIEVCASSCGLGMGITWHLNPELFFLLAQDNRVIPDGQGWTLSWFEV